MKALDLFCKAGGVTKGLQRAGFHVTGIDIEPQSNYCGDAFIQADALSLPVDPAAFDFIWASPPCQAYSWSARRWHDVPRADLVEPTRLLLEASGKPYCIENVPGAPIRADIVLTGTMFGLGVIRRRHFETSWFCLSPPPVRKRGSVRSGEFVTVAGHGGDGRAALHLWKEAMGIDWMTREELVEAIPPAYAEFIGRAFLETQRAADAA